MALGFIKQIVCIVLMRRRKGSFSFIVIIIVLVDDNHSQRLTNKKKNIWTKIQFLYLIKIVKFVRFARMFICVAIILVSTGKLTVWNILLQSQIISLALGVEEMFNLCRLLHNQHFIIFQWNLKCVRQFTPIIHSYVSQKLYICRVFSFYYIINSKTGFEKLFYAGKKLL